MNNVVQPIMYRGMTLTGAINTICMDCSAADLLAFLDAEDTTVEITNFQGTVFPLLPETVESLTFVNCTIPKSIAGFPENLETLRFTNCKTSFVSSIKEFPASLQSLTITNCGITTVPTLPANLINLSLDHNELTSLPNIAGLSYVTVSNNKIQKLNEISGNLQYGNFDNNQLTEIPPITTLHAPTLTFNNNPLQPPFKNIYAEYKRRGGDHWLTEITLRQEANRFLQTAVNEAYNAMTRSKGRNITTLSALAGRRKNNSFTRNTNTGAKEYTNISSVIGSFLTGKEGTLGTQITALKKNILGGKRRNKHTTRKQQKKLKH